MRMEITNLKYQITNKSQFQITKHILRKIDLIGALIFKNYLLFGSCYLRFKNFGQKKSPHFEGSSSLFTSFSEM